jgi:hypothetical protein
MRFIGFKMFGAIPETSYIFSWFLAGFQLVFSCFAPAKSSGVGHSYAEIGVLAANSS